MQIIKAIATLLFLVGVSCVAASTPTLGECKKLCKDTRQSILRDINPCQAAAKHSSSQKDFPLCVEGRKKAFDQACVPICTHSEITVTSFEGCQAVARGKGAQGVSWCRKGYDSILKSVGPFLNEHSKKLKQLEEESKSAEESVPVQNEPVVEVLDDAKKHVDPIVAESNHEPAAEEAVAVDSLSEEEESADAVDHSVVESKDPVVELEQHESEAKEGEVVVESSSDDESAATVDAEQSQDMFDSDDIESDIHQTEPDHYDIITPDDAAEPGKETEL